MDIRCPTEEKNEGWARLLRLTRVRLAICSYEGGHRRGPLINRITSKVKRNELDREKLILACESKSVGRSYKMYRKRFFLVIIIATTLLFMTDVSGAADANNTSQEIGSVIVRLQKERDAFRDFLEDQITPKIQEIYKTLKVDIREANALLRQLKNDPNSPELASQYEDCLSRALAKASSLLGQFSQTENPTLEAFDGVETSVKNAVSTFEHETEEAKKTAEDFQTKAKEFESHLKQLANQFQPQLESGDVLDAEIDAQIRCLETDRQITLWNARLSRMCFQSADESVKALRKQEQLLSRLKGDLKVAFNTASGQRLLVINLCKARQQGLTARHLLTQLKSVRNLGLRKTSLVESFGTTLQQLLNQGLNPVGIYEETSEVALEQPGAAILWKYLAKSSFGEDPNESDKPN